MKPLSNPGVRNQHDEGEGLYELFFYFCEKSFLPPAVNIAMPPIARQVFTIAVREMFSFPGQYPPTSITQAIAGWGNLKF